MMANQPSHQQQLTGSKRRRPEAWVDSHSKAATVSLKSSVVTLVRGGRSQTPCSEHSRFGSPEHCLISDYAVGNSHHRRPLVVGNISLLSNYEFEDVFHVKRSVFGRLAAALASQPAVTRSDLPIHVQLSVWLLLYMHTMPLDECGKVFTLSVPQIEELMDVVTSAILATCGEHLSWYTTSAKQKTAAISFEELCGLPGIVAAIGSTEFVCPAQSLPAMSFQAACDSTGCFKAIAMGWDNGEDALRTYQRAWCRHMDALVDEGYCCAAADGYPLGAKLLTPYPESLCPLEHQSYNCLLSLATRRTYHPIKQLQYRWRKLVGSGLNRLARDPGQVTNIITCFCILHNLSITTPDDEEEGRSHSNEMDEVDEEGGGASLAEYRAGCALERAQSATYNTSSTIDKVSPCMSPAITFWRDAAAATAKPPSPSAQGVDAYFAPVDPAEQKEEAEAFRSSLDAAAMFTIICRPELKEEMRKWTLTQKHRRNRETTFV